jgi:hypothetical protein
MICKRVVLLTVILPLLTFTAGCEDGAMGLPGPQGPAGPEGPPGPEGPIGDVDNGTSVETCIGCHGPGEVLPVASIQDPNDAHYIDTNTLGPLTPSLYRQLNIAISSVDVSGSSVIMDFTVTDEVGGLVDDIFAGDGRFTLARLMPGAGVGDSNLYDSLITRVATGAPGTPGDGNQAVSQMQSEGIQVITSKDLAVH